MSGLKWTDRVQSIHQIKAFFAQVKSFNYCAIVSIFLLCYFNNYFLVVCWQVPWTNCGSRWLLEPNTVISSTHHPHHSVPNLISTVFRDTDLYGCFSCLSCSPSVHWSTADCTPGYWRWRQGNMQSPHFSVPLGFHRPKMSVFTAPHKWTISHSNSDFVGCEMFVSHTCIFTDEQEVTVVTWLDDLRGALLQNCNWF